MDTQELLSEIDEAIANSADRVMLTALDAIGPCTYAMHMPSYVRLRVGIAHVDRWWWDWDRLPEPVYLRRFRQIEQEFHSKSPRKNYQLGYAAAQTTYDAYRRELVERLLFHHREMYRQPCLLCDSCQHRKKLWSTAPFSPFGLPLTKRSENLVKSLLVG